MQEEQMEMQPMEGQEQQMPQVDPIAMLIEDVLEKYTEAQTKLGLKCVEMAKLKGEEPEMELSDYINELQAYKESVYANLGQMMQDTEAYMSGGEMPGYDSNGFIGGPGLVQDNPHNENAQARYPENYDAGMFQEGGINEYAQQYPQQQAYRQGGTLNSMFKFKQGGKQMFQPGGSVAPQMLEEVSVTDTRLPNNQKKASVLDRGAKQIIINGRPINAKNETEFYNLVYPVALQEAGQNHTKAKQLMQGYIAEFRKQS